MGDRLWRKLGIFLPRTASSACLLATFFFFPSILHLTDITDRHDRDKLESLDDAKRQQERKISLSQISQSLKILGPLHESQKRTHPARRRPCFSVLFFPEGQTIMRWGRSTL